MRHCAPCFAALLSLAVASACSSSDSTPAQLPAGNDPAAMLAQGCIDALASIDETPTGLLPYDATKRGEIVRCASVATYTAEQLHAAAATVGYQGAAFESGAKAYRVLYRTERMAPEAGGSPAEGFSSALVLLPDKPRGGASTPLVVVAHGSVGVADKCAPSKGDLMGSGGHLDDFRSMVLPLAGYGWIVIATDYAGFGYGTTTGWMLAEDEAHSVLDATRAMGKLLKPGSTNGKVAVVGHSQGGHAAIATQAYAAKYGLEGTLVGVATYAPLWFAMRGFGAAIAAAAGKNVAKNASLLAYSLEYFYTHAELYDGAGHGVDSVKPEKQALAREILTTACGGDVGGRLNELGAVPADYLDDAFAKNVGACSGFNSATSCAAAPAPTWVPRFAKDRPAIDVNGAPIVLWQGALDETVTPPYAKCGVDKMRLDLGASTDKLKVCGDPTAVHGASADDANKSDGITRRAADWVNQWIGARAMGTAEPSACTGEEALQPEGGTLTCPNLPPNTD
jgi:pimeloyl-ACP methyl ester carboxylesterase